MIWHIRISFTFIIDIDIIIYSNTLSFSRITQYRAQNFHATKISAYGYLRPPIYWDYHWRDIGESYAYYIDSFVKILVYRRRRKQQRQAK